MAHQTKPSRPELYKLMVAVALPVIALLGGQALIIAGAPLWAIVGAWYVIGSLHGWRGGYARGQIVAMLEHIATLEERSDRALARLHDTNSQAVASAEQCDCPRCRARAKHAPN